MATLKKDDIFANRYRLIKRIGVGGYSEVWLVNDTKAGNLELALKIFAPEKGLDTKGLEIFSKEYSLVFHLNHKHLLIPKHFEDFEDSPYLVMPYYENGSVFSKIGEMTERDLANFILQSASAIEYLHEQDPPIIHQDIKPDNFLIDKNGDYLLTDFGISSKIRRTLTKSIGANASSGTIAYMPPEKWTRERLIIKAGDIFSLGVTLFELASGELPLGDQGGIMLSSGAEIPDLSSDFSPEFNELLRLCMSKETWNRPTAKQLQTYSTNFLESGIWKIENYNKPKDVVSEPIKEKNKIEEIKTPEKLEIDVPTVVEKHKQVDAIKITPKKDEKEIKSPTTPKAESRKTMVFEILPEKVDEVDKSTLNNLNISNEKVITKFKDKSLTYSVIFIVLFVVTAIIILIVSFILGNKTHEAEIPPVAYETPAIKDAPAEDVSAYENPATPAKATTTYETHPTEAAPVYEAAPAATTKENPIVEVTPNQNNQEKTIFFNNMFSNYIKIAIAYKVNNNFISKGWYNIPPDGVYSLPLPLTDNDILYYYILSTYNEKDGTLENFCVDKNLISFTFYGQTACDDYNKVGFKKIKLKDLYTHIFLN